MIPRGLHLYLFLWCHVAYTANSYIARCVVKYYWDETGRVAWKKSRFFENITASLTKRFTQHLILIFICFWLEYHPEGGLRQITDAQVTQKRQQAVTNLATYFTNIYEISIVHKLHCTQVLYYWSVVTCSLVIYKKCMVFTHSVDRQCWGMSLVNVIQRLIYDIYEDRRQCEVNIIFF